MKLPAASAALAAATWLSGHPPAGGPILFENVVESTGIRFALDNHVTERKHQIETMIAGLALFDYNNDGWLDLYFVNGAEIPGLVKSHPRYYNRLYKNNGDMTFTDVTEAAGVRGEGYGMGIAVGDYDNDGWQDFYLAGVNRNQLFHNNQDGTFTDVTDKAGVSGLHPKYGKTWSISAGWFDYDTDGDLDLFVVNYVVWSLETEPECRVEKVRAYCSPNSYEGLPNFLYRNNGDGTFTDVSEASGIGRYIGKGMGVAFADYDGNGFPDVFVSNDTYRHFLFRNKGDGTFTEQAILSGVAYNENGKSIAGMGTDFRDVNNDGLPDIFVVAMVGDTFPLFLNRGRDFRDATSLAGIARATIGVTAWGSGIADFDNDGWKDLFASCAAILDNSEQIDRLPAELPPMVLRNLGNGGFLDVSAQAGASFRAAARHRGVAFGDLNNDGRIDAVITKQHELPAVFLNRSPAGHWLLLDLKGTRGNRDGLGAGVKVVLPDGRTLYNHSTTSVGYSASSDKRVHFGLGAAEAAERIEILWPGGSRQVLSSAKADQILAIREP